MTKDKSSRQPDDSSFERLKLLFDYTKFHIGIYITLSSAAIAAASSGGFDYVERLFWMGLILIALAGFCGGIIASNLPEAETVETFYRDKTGPRRSPLMRGRNWASLEHYFFWIGMSCLLGSFALPL